MRSALCCISIISFLSGFGHSNDKGSPVSIHNLRCEYLNSPLGIDVTQPRLSWELIAGENAMGQSAYQILVASDPALLMENKANLWNSGRVNSNQTNQIKYKGNVLQSRTYYYWKVRIWDKKGEVSNWSAITYWSVGLLNIKDWRAKWIGAATGQVPKEQQYYINHGYRSGIAPSPEANEWIIIDLGKNEEINEMRLFPVQPLKKTPWLMLMKDHSENAKSYLFPVQFKIDLSENEDFREYKTIADESREDYSQEGVRPYIKRFDSQKARYVRLRVFKLSPLDTAQYSYPIRLRSDSQGSKPAKTNPVGYAFALAEFEVFGNTNENLALNKPVKESHQYPALQPATRENWSPEVLVDGFLEANAEKPNSIGIPPSPLLRKEFEIKKKLKSALLYVTALGLYEARINGQKVGSQVLAPEWTDYYHRVQYQVYDVTSFLNDGMNTIGAMLADGWYAGAVFSHPNRGSYGFNRRLIAQLEINYSDGTNNIVPTDESWKIFDNGPIQQASIFDGELFDATLWQKGWDEPGFNDASWQKVIIDTTVSINLSAQMNEPIKVIKELQPVSVFKVKENTYIFDLGQNIAGWIRLSIPYNTDGKIIFRYGEMLNEDSTLYTANLRGAKQTDTYIAGKEEQIHYEPRFTYHGFRYVQISGLPQVPSLNSITAKVVASASPSAGSFETSNSAINKLWRNIVWTQRGNMHSVPTDCPQRDERAGWTGDAQVFSQTAIFNMDMAGFFTKWIRDIRDSQAEDGRFSDWAPSVGTWWNHYNSPGWADAGIIVPWKMFLNYSDTTVLEKQYGSMKKFIDNIFQQNHDFIWRNVRGEMYGDWLNGDEISYYDYPRQGGKVPDEVYSTAFFAYSTGIASEIAKVLDKKQEEKYYGSLADSIKNAFRREFISDDGRITGNTQAGYALALEFDIVPENLKRKAVGHMVDCLLQYDNRMSTGIQSTIRLMNQLSENGYSDIAYRLLESKRFPSWLYSIDQGATTIWERWDGYVKGRGLQNAGMNSFNHYAIGAVGEWMFRHILGINYSTENPGYRHVIIKPEPGGSLIWAKGTYHSINGAIAVSWTKDREKFELDIQIPVNTVATVILPVLGKKIAVNGSTTKKTPGVHFINEDEGEKKLLVQSGRYRFKVF